MYDVFISYRRKGGEWLAYSIYLELFAAGYSVFFDKESLSGGDYEKAAIEAVKKCTDFILILPPNALNRCLNEDDLLFKEIKTAIDNNKLIIPIVMSEFSWDDIECETRNNMIVAEYLSKIPKQNGCEPKGIMDIDATLIRLKQHLLKSKPIKKEREYEKCNIEGRLLSNLTTSEYFIEHSRDKEFVWLTQELAEKRPVFVWGMGGIGKTELVLQYAMKYKKTANIYFARFSNSVRNTIINLQFSDYVMPDLSDLGDKEKSIIEEKIYREKLDLLNKYGVNDILIVDNFDSGEKTLTELKQEQAYSDLMGIHMQIIFTTRECPDKKTPEITSLETEYVIELMRQYVGDGISYELLKNLAESVNKHTLAVELISRAIGDDIEPADPEYILQCLSENNLSKLDEYVVESVKDRKYEEKTIYEHIRSLFRLSNLSNGEKELLKRMTMVSSHGINLDVLVATLRDNEEKKSLKKLIKKGWIKTNKESVLCLHPLVKDIGLSEFKPQSNEYKQFVHELFNGPLNDLRWDMAFEYNRFNELKNKVRLIAETYAEIYNMCGTEAILIAARAAEAFDMCADFEKCALYSHCVLDQLINTNSDIRTAGNSYALDFIIRIWCPNLEESSWDPEMYYGNELLEDHSGKPETIQGIYKKLIKLMQK